LGSDLLTLARGWDSAGRSTRASRIVIRLKASIGQKIPWLRAAVITLALAVLATALGTIVD